MNARPLLALALALVPARTGASDFTERAVGTAGSEFLNVDVGPRGIAMGGAQTAVTNDAYAMYWNPAGLTQVPRISLGAMHNEYLAGIRFQYLSYAQRFTDTSVMATAVRLMDAGSITNTDINGNTLGTFRPRSYVWELGWARKIADLTDSEREISLGLNGRFLHSDLVAHANGYAGDLGIQAHYSDALIPHHFGFVVQNLGQGQKFDDVRDTLPFRGKLGVSALPRPFLLLALDAVFPISNRPYGAVGVELKLEPQQTTKAFLRLGYNSRNQFNGLDGLKGLTAGAGIKVLNLTFDYAFTPFGFLGDVHRFAFTWDLPPKHSRRFRDR